MVEKFKFWCQKVLPTIYDDSLSYYEAICKMATYLDATIDQVNEFQKMIDALPETILNSEEFQKMVQDAVDGKIDALYKVVQDALDAFDQEIDAMFTDMKSELDADQAAFEKQVNDNNTVFQKQIEKDFTTLELTTKHRMVLQDDKITEQNTTIESFKTEVNGKLTGYETSDAQFKQEVNTKLSGYESDNAQFKSQVNAKVDEIPTKIAEYPKYPLCQNSNGAVTQEFDVAMTYYHNDKLIYGNYHTPFNTSATAQSGKYEIDCSSFVQLCLMGVPYENTRWFNDKNAAVSGYYFGDDLIIDPEADRPYGMLSDDMCKWFVEHGYYFETDDPSQLKPGDVVFMTFNTESPTYKHITHCGLFVSYQAITDEIWCISASNTSNARPYVVSRESYKRTSESFVGFGRLPLPDCKFNANNLINNGLTQDLSGIKSVNIAAGSYIQDMGRLRFIRDATLEPNKMYTLALNVTNAYTPLYFTIQSGSTTFALASTSESEWIFVPFCLNFPNTPNLTVLPVDNGLGACVASVYARIRDTQTAGLTRQCNFKKIALYEGVVISPIEVKDELCKQTVVTNKPTTMDNDDPSTPVPIAQFMSDVLVFKPIVKNKIQISYGYLDVSTVTPKPTFTTGHYMVLTWTEKPAGDGEFNAGQLAIGLDRPYIFSRFHNGTIWTKVLLVNHEVTST